MKLPLLQYPSLLLLFFILLLLGCKKEEEPRQPEVETQAIKLLSPSTVELKGNIVNTGKLPVLDYGFVYGPTPDVNGKSGHKISLGKDAKTGVYTQNLAGLGSSTAFYTDRTLYVRAFIENQLETRFGQLTSVSIPSYMVTDMKPQTGKAGDRVTLTGKFYTNDIREVEATFAGVPAKVLEVTPLKIVVEAPHITNSGSYSGYSVPVELRLQGQSFQVGFNFQVLPVIKDFSPKSGAVGTTFFISAENLASYDSYFPDKLKVFMGGVEVRVLNSYYSSTGFNVVVPGNLTADRVTVSVLLDGVRTNLPGSFTVIPPTVTSISPASGLPESGFSIFGSNFIETSPYYSNNISVEMGDVPLHLAHVSADKLTAWVPEDLPAGDYRVVVKTGLHTVEAPQQYRVYHPSITSISPTSGYYNQRVIISGVFKPDQYFAVDFGSTSTGAYSTANSLEVYVPAGTEAGKVKVSVKHGKRLLVAEEEFMVLAPTITSFSPTTGAAGSIITISGVGFAPNTSHMFVKFGTVEATILYVTHTDIRVMVPSGVTGSMKITLDQSGQIVSSNNNFTVTN